MGQLRFLLYFSAALFFASFFACKDDFDNYSTSPNDVLTFSIDTLSFDTVFSTIQSPSREFMVYNRNKKSLLISSIELTNNKESGFRINVDGLSGSQFKNVEIGAGDSLYVRVDVETGANQDFKPVLITDYITFTTNSVQQKVVLEAYGQDAYIWKGKVIESSTVLANDKPYLIYDSLQVNENVTLTISEGTNFYLHKGAEVKVLGNIKAKGTLEKPIVFRGDRTDEMLNIPYDRIPGQWDGFFFAASSFNNELEYVHIRNGSYGLGFELSDPGQSKLKIKNSIVTNVTGTLITAINCWIEGENCEFSNSREALMYLTGGKYNFTHCTLANYYFSNEQWGISSNRTLVLTNKYYENSKPKALPLLQADFANTIIWGNSSKSGIDLAKDTTDFPSTEYSYLFKNCLIPNNGSNDSHFVSCIFNKNPEFLVSGSDGEEEFVYDFRLDSISPARNQADPVISAKIPYDMNAVSRFLDQGPDMGAYEWVPQKKQ